MKTKLLSFLVVLMAFVMVANAQDFVIADFESDELGKTYPTFYRWGAEEDKGTATVVADPSGKENNKAVNLVTTNYDCVFKIDATLPEGKTLGDYLAVSFDVYFSNDAWKCMFLYLDGDMVFRNTKVENGEVKDDYPKQADGNVWTTKTYTFSMLDLQSTDLAKTSFNLAFGVSDNAANYYIDNIKLIAPKNSESGYLTIDDFEDKEVGDTYGIKAWAPTDGEAKVSLDPEDNTNKVINMVCTNWNAVPAFNVILPTGKQLGDYESISFDLYNTNSYEWANYKKSEIYIDGTKVFDEPGDDESAPIDKWTNKSFKLEDMTLTDDHKAKSGFTLGAGISIGQGNYYMDNIMLKEKGTGLVQNIVKAIIVAVQNGKLLIQGDNVTKVDVYDSKGMHCTSVKNESAVDISALDKGIYIVKVQTESGTFTNKVIK